ncbi:MAG: hypothetical protein A4S09_05735 [Proteobacteria bacterium SG_bin7]|nr:MAG: hypothetical protein A4S09_05735 [Proteobacteria bacterium SG_bin7]
MKFCLHGLVTISMIGLGACSTLEGITSDNGGRVSVAKPSPTLEFSNSDSDPMARRTQADYHFAMGETYANEGQSEKAIEEFRHTLVYDPDSAMVRFRLAKEYVRVGLIAEAIENAEQAVKLDPKTLDTRFLLGAMYSSMKMYDKARAQYEEAKNIEPENADAQLYIGALLAEEGKYDEAVKYFEGLTRNKKFSNTYLAWYYVGRIRAQQGTPKSTEQAEKAFDKALSAKPDFSDAVLALAAVYQGKSNPKKAIDVLASFQDRHGPNAHVAEVLAPLYMDQEKFDQAYQQFEIAAESDPDDLNVLLKMAHILFTQKKYDAAIDQLEKLLARVPDSDKVRYFLAAVYMEKGNYDLAIKNFEQVLPTSQLYLQAVVLQAHSYRATDKKDKALLVLKEALKIRKDLPQFYSSLSALLSENKDYDQAMHVIREGVERFPNNTDLRFLLGTLYDKVGKIEQTIEEMNKVLEVNPDHAQALNYVAYTYADQNKLLDQAEAMARRASEIEPEDGYILDTLGWTLYKQGRTIEAIKTLEAAFKLKNDESVIAEHLGDAYYKNQMTSKARAMYKKALELEKNEQQVTKIKSKLMALESQTSKERLPASKKSK